MMVVAMRLESLKNSTYSFTFHPNLEDFSEAQKNAYIETCYKVQYDLLKQFEKIGIFKPTGKLEIKKNHKRHISFYSVSHSESKDTKTEPEEIPILQQMKASKKNRHQSNR